MNLVQTENFYESVSKGNHYLDVMAANIEKGGNIVKLNVTDLNNNRKIAEIVTDYADGLLVTRDVLTYHDDFLQRWDLIMNEKRTVTIFRRDEYNFFREQIKTNH
ncbi:hypothetical protein JQN58_05100 [Aneurinibacillus sp. BA2021]|nr:hypothetical protein [Aneurinibacillus sp. BA2021]